MLINIALAASGLVLLWKGADFFVSGASALAAKFRVAPLVVGLTVVAFGTSAPELTVNLFASLGDAGDVAVGNVVGSNIFNILVILGMVGVIKPITVGRSTVWKEIPFSLLAVLVLLVAANDALLDRGMASFLSRSDGLLLLAFFAVFVVYTFGMAKVEGQGGGDLPQMSWGRLLLWMGLGLAGLVLGGRLAVDNGVALARLAGISERVIGLTLLSGGTSLPELITSLVAAKKGQTDIAVGNVVGSNIFNVFFVLALSVIVQPLNFNPVMNRDLLVLLLASLVLFLTMFTFRRRTLDRREAAFLLAAYGGYLVWLLL